MVRGIKQVLLMLTGLPYPVHDRVDDVDVNKHPLEAMQGPERSLPCQTTSSMLHYYLECSGSARVYIKVG